MCGTKFCTQCRILFRQIGVLFTKRWLLLIRNWKGTTAQILSPILIVILLFCFQLLSNYILGRSIENPPITPVGPLPPCTSRNELECTTILYAPDNVTWVQNIMKKIAMKNGLIFEKHFKVFPSNPLNTTWTTDYEKFADYFLVHENQTQNGIFFKVAYNKLYQSDVIPPDPGYFIFFNSTNKNHDYLQPIMKSLTESILEMKANVSNPITIDISTSSYPTKFRIAVYDVVASNGATWFFIPPMITFFIVLTEIVFEKEKHLRIGMRMMGLSNTAYWTVWWFTGIILCSLSSLVLIAAGAVAQFSFFLNANQFCIYLLFLFFGIGIISFAMFLSTLISKSETAQTVGYALILCGFVFQIILSSGDGILIRLIWSAGAPDWVVFLRWLLTFYPPFNMAKVFCDIAVKASDTLNPIEGRVIKGVGFYWSDLWEKSTISYGGTTVTVPSPAETFGWLLVSAVTYILLMWYLDNVLPGEHGSPKPPYFFFLSRYWGFGKRRKRSVKIDNDDDDETTHSKVSFVYTPQLEDDITEDPDVAKEQFNAVNPSNSSPLKIINISKVYRKYPIVRSEKDVVAVNSLSLTGEEGEILCLLGHNGAGKTTLVNMLTGLFQPTNGTGIVYGYDVNEDIDSIRQIMGVCPQHDILWSELTAREHLNLFAKLKGFNSTDAVAETERILKEISLYNVADNRVSSFSGGMKRRLSVGISTIGNPRIIFMDEPTTGLDPVNKRGIWHMMQDLKSNRVIILTTHSMEEADVLSDKVAIMAYGSLKCVGSSLHLKNRFGTGYRINLISKNDRALINIMKKQWVDLMLEENEAGSLQFTIPAQFQESIPDILNYLEQNPDDLVEEWGLAHATLEEVFLRVTKKSNFKYEEIAGNDQEKSENQEYSDDTKLLNDNNDDEHVQLEDDNVQYSPTEQREMDLKRSTYPLRALFRKNMTLQSRQKCTNVCQILTPVLVVIILVILQAVIKAQLGPNYNVRYNSPSYPFPLNNPYALDDYFSSFEEPNFNFSNHIGENYTGDCLQYFLYSEDEHVSVGNLTSDGKGSGLLGYIKQSLCFQETLNVTHIPYFNKHKDLTTINKDLFGYINILNEVPIENVDKPPHNQILPDGYVIFNKFNVSEYQLDIIISVNTNSITSYHRENNFTKVSLKHIPFPFDEPIFQQLKVITTQGWAQMIDLIGRAFTNDALISHGKPPLTPMVDGLDSVRFVQSMPYMSSASLMDMLEEFGSFLYPIAMTMQLPIYAFLLVLEKKNKLRQMMKSHGLKNWHYFFVNYLFFFTLYALSITFFWLSGIGVQLRFFVQTDPIVLLLFYIAWGFALISLAFLISAFISEPRASTVIGYAIALIGTLTAIAICVGVYGPFSFSVQPVMPTGLLIWPQFGFTRGIYLMNEACAATYSCYQFHQLVWGDELLGCIISLYICGIVYFIIFCYLDAVLPQEYGVPKKPLFFLDPIIKCFYGQSNTIEISVEERNLIEIESTEDPDVAQARKAVLKGQFTRQDPLVLNQLRKVYDDDKVAVKSLSLIVKKNTCFGLLGENGAGKTTTISMLTGLFPPTSGHAIVGGYDITTEIDMVHLVIGLCPQFDVLWDDLSCEEHLLFYARLKGIPPNEEDAHVTQILKEVGLHNERDRSAVNLSGGMRRRLSLAISFVGKSRITFLDEPTTGLDPASRRHIWTIIARGKKDRAIILTTHSMDEAETLCNNIGILAHGVLRCLGSPQHLMYTHGEGYLLTISYDPNDKKVATKFIKKTFLTSVRSSRFRGTDQYKIPRTTVQVSDVFSKMEKESKVNGINDWSISQLGLEELFQSIVKSQYVDTPESQKKYSI